jgi:RPA family protein
MNNVGTQTDGGRKDGAFTREPARRVFADEFRECRYDFKDGNDEKSPTFVLLPTGERANRIFLIGILTEKSRHGEENMFYRGQVVDSTGTFYIMAGSYNPEAMQQLAKIDTQEFVAVIGKPNLFKKPDGALLVSVRVESITVVNKEIRDLWVLDTASHTLDRLDAMSLGTAPDVIKVKEVHPNMDPSVFRKMVYNALAQIKI